jgi:hypothetical protein
MSAAGAQSGCEPDSLHAGEFISYQFVRAVLYPFRRVRVGGSAFRRVVLEAAVLRWIVGRRNHDAIGEVILAAAIVDQDGARDDGVGVTASFRWMTVSTPLAARTSSAVRCAGAESACVSLPM